MNHLFRMRFLMPWASVLFVMSNAFADEKSHTEAQYEAAIAALCKENNAPIKRQQGSAVFSWTDENGNVHFGDRPPQNVQAEAQTLSGRRDYFEVKIQYPDSTPDAELTEALDVNGRAIAHAMSQFIPKNRMTKSTIDMKVFTRQSSFFEYKRQVAPSLSNNVVGFYSALDNSVAVWHRGSVAYTRETALHEATHVFQYKNLGMLPGWISEGMAVYFENLDVSGNAKVVKRSPYYNRYFQRQRTYIPLTDLLTANYANWQGANGSAFYANSWAFFHFMMLPENRSLMKILLENISEDKCNEEPADASLAFFEQRYRGGVNQLQEDWIRWLRTNSDVPNYH